MLFPNKTSVMVLLGIRIGFLDSWIGFQIQSRIPGSWNPGFQDSAFYSNVICKLYCSFVLPCSALLYYLLHLSFSNLCVSVPVSVHPSELPSGQFLVVRGSVLLHVSGQSLRPHLSVLLPPRLLGLYPLGLRLHVGPHTHLQTLFVFNVCPSL